MYANFFELVGRTIVDITAIEPEGDYIQIKTNDGTYSIYHQQDCCEFVRITKVIGNPQDLVGQEIVFAEDDSVNASGGTLTTQKLCAANGAELTIVWLGESNGYYSETVTVSKSV